jgi:hypothetical protein
MPDRPIAAAFLHCVATSPGPVQARINLSNQSVCPWPSQDTVPHDKVLGGFDSCPRACMMRPRLSAGNVCVLCSI